MRNDFQVREKLAKGGMPPRNKTNFRPTKSGAGMTEAGVKVYRRMNPGSKLKTAVTGKVKPGSKAAKRRKSFCARSAGPKTLDRRAWPAGRQEQAERSGDRTQTQTRHRRRGGPGAGAPGFVPTLSPALLFARQRVQTALVNTYRAPHTAHLSNHRRHPLIYTTHEVSRQVHTLELWQMRE